MSEKQAAAVATVPWKTPQHPKAKGLQPFEDDGQGADSMAFKQEVALSAS
jgi:hypothetical protein